MRTLSGLLSAVVFALALAGLLAPDTVRAQIDPAVRDRVLPAAVQVGLLVTTTEDGVSTEEYLSVGSGTIVSPDGLILTNWHVVDMAANRDALDAWEAHASRGGVSLKLELEESQLVILTTGTGDVPEPTFLAQVVAEHHALDLAVLRITSDTEGRPLAPSSFALPYVPLGDSAAVRQGDPVYLFAYPVMGGGTLQYTAGVVSGFNVEEGIEGRAWITTDATMAGGSSGGTAVDDEGRLIGVPTQGAELDCRPGDTNFDGTVDAQDVGCIPVGGSIGQLRPSNLARAILTEAGFNPPSVEEAAPVEAAPVESAPALPPDTNIVGDVPEGVPAEPPPPGNMDILDPEAAPTEAAPVEAAPPPQGNMDVIEPVAGTEEVVPGAPEGPPPPANMPGEPIPPQTAPPPAETSYVYAEDYCRTGPLYPPGTQIVLPRDVEVSLLGVPRDVEAWSFVPALSVNASGNVLVYAKLWEQLPAGTVVEVTGPYFENGSCDWWPVRFQTGDGVESEGYVNEWDLSPEFPNQVAPLPPEWQSIAPVLEELCLSNTDYALGEVRLLTHESPGYSYRRGYGFEQEEQIEASTYVEIVGSPVETGVCDMWLITYEVSATLRSDAGGHVIEDMYDTEVSGYIHESDLEMAIP